MYVGIVCSITPTFLYLNTNVTRRCVKRWPLPLQEKWHATPRDGKKSRLNRWQTWDGFHHEKIQQIAAEIGIRYEPESYGTYDNFQNAICEDTIPAGPTETMPWARVWLQKIGFQVLEQ